MLLRLLRQLSAVLCKELEEDHAAVLQTQPGALFFSKHVHELRDPESEAPDGLSIEYLERAIAKNEAVWRGAAVDSAVGTLAFHLSRQISQAVLLERRLVAKLEQLR